LRAPDKVDHEQEAVNRLEFDYPAVDMDPFKKDPRLREIPELLLEKIGKGKKRLENQIETLQRNTAIRYPATVVLPYALYDLDCRIVIDAHVTLGQKSKYIFLQVRFAAPTIAFADDRKLLGISAHEFLHYVKHTISMHQYSQQHGSLEGMRLGEVPQDVKDRGVRFRDEYHTVSAKDWLSGDVFSAWEDIEKESFTVSSWADLIVREWIGKGYPTEDFVRGRVTRPDTPGKVLRDIKIIEKARRLGLVT
jgi:hypothetical protein